MLRIINLRTILAICAVVLPIVASATPVTVNFSGDITGINSPLDGEAPFSVGDTATAWLTYDPAAPKDSACCFSTAVIDFGLDLGNGAVWNYDPLITSQTVTQGRYSGSNGWFQVWNYDLSGISGSVTAPEYNSPATLLPGASSYNTKFVPWQTLFFFNPPVDQSVLPQLPDFTSVRTDYVIQYTREDGGLVNLQQGVTVSWDEVSFEGQQRVPIPGTLTLFGLGLAGLGFARRKKA